MQQKTAVLSAAEFANAKRAFHNSRARLLRFACENSESAPIVYEMIRDMEDGARKLGIRFLSACTPAARAA